MANSKPNYLAYAAPSNSRSDKPWRLIGAAWDNNGYISVVLDAFPMPGNKLVLAPPKPNDSDQTDATARQRDRRDNETRRRT